MVDTESFEKFEHIDAMHSKILFFSDLLDDHKARHSLSLFEVCGGKRLRCEYPHAPWRRPSGHHPRVHGLASGQIEPIELHHLRPGRHEVADELLIAFNLGVHLGNGPQLGVGSEDEIGARAGPP